MMMSRSSNGIFQSSMTMATSRPSPTWSDRSLAATSRGTWRIHALGAGSFSAMSTSDTATTRCGLPSSVTVKSSTVRPRTGCRFLSRTETSSRMTSTSPRKTGCCGEVGGCAGGCAGGGVCCAGGFCCAAAARPAHTSTHTTSGLRRRTRQTSGRGLAWMSVARNQRAWTRRSCVLRSPARRVTRVARSTRGSSTSALRHPGSRFGTTARK